MRVGGWGVKNHILGNFHAVLPIVIGFGPKSCSSVNNFVSYLIRKYVFQIKIIVIWSTVFFLIFLPFHNKIINLYVSLVHFHQCCATL